MKWNYYNILYGKTPYKPYVIGLCFIITVIIHYYCSPTAFSNFIKECDNLYIEFSGANNFNNNIESQTLSKLLAFFLAYIFFPTFMGCFYCVWVYFFSFIPLYICNKILKDRKILTVPLPWIGDVTDCIIYYAINVSCFILMLGLHTEMLFFVFEGCIRGTVSLPTEDLIIWLGFIFFMVITYVVLFYNSIKSLSFLLIYDFCLFLVPIIFLFWEILLVPFMSIVPAFFVMFVLLTFYRIPAIWTAIDNTYRKKLRYITAYSILTILLIFPFIFGVWCLYINYDNYFSDSIWNSYDTYVVEKFSEYIPFVFSENVFIDSFELRHYLFISKILYTIVLFVLLLFLLLYLLYVFGCIYQAGRGKDLALREKWKILYLRSFSEENAEFELSLKKYHNTLIVNNPSDSMDFMMSGIYLNDVNWKEYVTRYSELSKHVVIKIGKTNGVKWEMEHITNRPNVHFYINKEYMQSYCNMLEAKPKHNIDLVSLTHMLTNQLHKKNYKYIILTYYKDQLLYCLDNDIESYIRSIDNLSCCKALRKIKMNKVSQLGHDLKDYVIDILATDDDLIAKDKVEEYKKKAESGDYEAVLDMMELYKIDESEFPLQAIGFYRIAANAGNAKAMERIGWLYQHILHNEDECVSWYTKAAKLHNLDAMMNLASIHDKKQNESNKSKVLYWYKKASEQGNVEAMIYLANWYYAKDEVETKLKALSFYHKAADLGNYEAMYKLGTIYYEGAIVAPNIIKSKEYIRIAMKHNIKKAKKFYNKYFN